MRHILLSALAAVSVAATGAFTSAHADVITIDFNDLGRGDTIADQYSEHVKFSSAPGRNGFGVAMVFDTKNFSGGDRDLKGKLKHSVTGKKKNFKKIAIISEDNDASDPDDNATGGSLIMSFAEGVTFFGFDAIDINHKESITLDLFGADGTNLGTFSNGKQTAKDREFFEILTGGVSDVFKAVINLSGSGAVDNIKFQTALAPAPVPVPAALPLMLTGLGGMFWARRKKAAA